MRFDLYRSTESGFTPSDETKYKSNLALTEGTYKLTIQDIPRYDPYGQPYYYLLQERDGTKGELVVKEDPLEIDAPNVSGESKNVTVKNTFPAKRIRVDKYWDDSDNIDGMRPTKLDYTITETVPDINDPININKTLENDNNWYMYVELPKYYYNGNARTDGLRYKIDEDLTSYNDSYYGFNPEEAGYYLYQSGYYFANGSMNAPDGYFVGGGTTGSGGEMWEDEEEDLGFKNTPLDSLDFMPLKNPLLKNSDFIKLDNDGAGTGQDSGDDDDDEDPDVGHQEDEFFDDDPPPISNDDGVLIISNNDELEGLYLKNT